MVRVVNLNIEREQLERYLRKASDNYRRPFYALKCDVKKFFDSISHVTLLALNCDDFIILDNSPTVLSNFIPIIRSFLLDSLQLTLHPKKISIRKISTGIDFLGYVVLPHYRVVRTSTRKRIFRKLSASGADAQDASVDSYIGITTHAKGYLIKQRILEICAGDNCGMDC